VRASVRLSTLLVRTVGQQKFESRGVRQGLPKQVRRIGSARAPIATRRSASVLTHEKNLPNEP
jgi:hypothetical protein